MDSVRSGHVIWEMFRRDLTSQYRQSRSGVLFSRLTPLAATAWAILFRNAHLIDAGRSSVPFFVLCGLMLWAAFLEALDAPISGVFFNFVVFNFAVEALAVAVAAVFYRIHVPWTVSLAPFGVALIGAPSVALILASVIMGQINPVTQILMATRDLIFPGSGGTREGLIAASIFALTLFFGALIFHRGAMPSVLDRANSR